LSTSISLVLLMLSFLAFCILVVQVASAKPQPPFWGPAWSAPFNQTITIDYIFVFNNSVVWKYDSSTTPVGSSVYMHSKGQNDELCTSVKGKERSDEPCTLLASTDGWRRVIFPESGLCCKFCNVSQFCGIVAPDWLQKESTYQGQKQIEGMTCDGWLKVGGEQNFYYADAASQQPCVSAHPRPNARATKNTLTPNSPHPK
jgi:hypothetical protein